jgi:mevalonate pyrophosphate decarboxylase
MMAAAKRTNTFFTQVPGTAGGSSSSSAAAAAFGEGVGGYRLYTKEEFEAANKTQVSCKNIRSITTG